MGGVSVRLSRKKRSSNKAARNLTLARASEGFVVYESTEDDSVSKVVRDGLARARAEQRDLDELHARLLTLFAEVGPVRLVALASLLYLNFDPDVESESDHDRNPAHIEYLALQALGALRGKQVESQELHPLALFQAAIDALNTSRDLFLHTQWSFVSDEIAKECPASPSREFLPPHALRAKIESLMIRIKGFPQHVETVLQGCFGELDAELREAIGYTAAEAIKISHAIARYNAEEVDGIREHSRRRAGALLIQLKRERRGRATNPTLPKEMLGMPFRQAEDRIYALATADAINKCAALMTFRPSDIAHVSGVDIAACTAFLATISCASNDYIERHHKYPTGPHPVTEHPILQIDSQTFFAPCLSSIIEAIRPCMEDAVRDNAPKLWERYQKQHRATYLEAESARLLSTGLAGSKAWRNVHWKVSEDLKGELDGIVNCDVMTLRLQCKAARVGSSARRGAPKTMESDLAKGIGHASAQHAALDSALSAHSLSELGFTPEQAEALMAPWQLNVIVCLDDVTVWATHAHELRRLGAVGTNEPTPWVVSLLDLMVICDFLEDGQMAQYLLRRQRLERDGRVTAHDELDWLGNYIREGLHFEDILYTSGGKKHVALTTYTEMFDHWYHWKAGIRSVQTPKPQRALPAALQSYLHRLATSRPPGWIVASICLLEGDPFTWRKELERYVARVAETGSSNLSLAYSHRFGLTFLARKLLPIGEVRNLADEYGQRKIAETGVPHWIFLCQGADNRLVVQSTADPTFDGLCTTLMWWQPID